MLREREEATALARELLARFGLEGREGDAPDDVLGAPQRSETQRFLRRLLDAGRL